MITTIKIVLSEFITKEQFLELFKDDEITITEYNDLVKYPGAYCSDAVIEIKHDSQEDLLTKYTTLIQKISAIENETPYGSSFIHNTSVVRVWTP